jgi:hypothetical protein
MSSKELDGVIIPAVPSAGMSPLTYQAGFIFYYREEPPNSLRVRGF